MILEVNASTKYNIVINKGARFNVGELALGVVPKCKVLLVTDDFIPSSHYETVINSLNLSGYKTYLYKIPYGEKSKSVEEFAKILSYMAENTFSRKDLIVAVGGGVVGDLAGFVASTYRRGIKFINIPTTLLACIDSSVGGKTAVNLPYGKNLVGTFYQPSLVVCDSEFLQTLPEDIFKDGLGEAIKYGIINKAVWDILKNGVIGNIDALIYECLKIKKDIVEKDEKESGLRQILNLGHTFGHAIETLSSYGILHGFAVSKGIAIMARLSVVEGKLSSEEEKEILSVITQNGIDYSCPYSIKEMKEIIKRDKKANSGKVNLVCIKKIGEVLIENKDIDKIEI